MQPVAPYYRPVLKLQSLTHEATADLGQFVHDNLSLNVGVFATPSVSLSFQQTGIDNLVAANNAWGHPGNRGSHQNHLDVIAARVVVEQNLRSLQGYIAGVALGDPVVIGLSGLSSTKVRTPFGILPAVQNVHQANNKHTPSGAYRIRWKKVKGANGYDVFAVIVSGGSIPDPDSLPNPYIYQGTVSKTVFSSTYFQPAGVASPSLIGSGVQLAVFVIANGTSEPGPRSDVALVRTI